MNRLRLLIFSAPLIPLAYYSYYRYTPFSRWIARSMPNTRPKFTGSPETYANHYDCSYHFPLQFDFTLLPPCNVFYYLATKNLELNELPSLDFIQNILDASLLGKVDEVKRLHSDALAKNWSIPLQLMATAATERGHALIVQYCLEKGAEIDADISMASMRGSSPDLYAVLMKAGWPKPPRTLNMVLRSDLWKGESVVRFLLDRGAQIGPGVFSLAAAGCDVSTLGLLISRGAQIHDSGALQSAAYNGMLANVKFLLDKGARINEIPKQNPGDERDFNNGTALHKAVDGSAVNVVEYLLKHGADTQIRDQRGRTALQIAKERGGKHMNKIMDLLDRATTKL